MTTLGLVLLVLGLILGAPWLWIIGIVLMVLGTILFGLGSAGRGVGGRQHYY